MQDYSKNSQLPGRARPRGDAPGAAPALRPRDARRCARASPPGSTASARRSSPSCCNRRSCSPAPTSGRRSARFQPTAAETDAYIAAHPELDTKAERAKLEGILARVRAGEDFVKLANEFTEDPSGKGNGGDLGWFGRGMMVKPFEDTAFALKPGEVSGVFETQFGFHIVKLDERRHAGRGRRGSRAPHPHPVQEGCAPPELAHVAARTGARRRRRREA